MFPSGVLSLVVTKVCVTSGAAIREKEKKKDLVSVSKACMMMTFLCCPSVRLSNRSWMSNQPAPCPVCRWPWCRCSCGCVLLVVVLVLSFLSLVLLVLSLLSLFGGGGRVIISVIIG